MFLGESEVHVYSASLQCPPERIQEFHAILSPEEKAKAVRFHFPSHQTRYVVSHGLLRTILAAYLPVPPAGIVFEHNQWGKPGIAGAEVFFNMSHSGDRAVYAVAPEAQVGVDIECIRPVSDHAAIAARYFAEAEAREVLSTAPGVRLPAFYNCWTRKEAYIKALGMGLSAPLDNFQVTLVPEHPPRFVTIDGDSEQAGKWSLFDLRPAPGYIGALAIWGTGWQLCPREISEGAFPS
jgi:4'-phosphopantetheinyl transferase